MLPPHPTLCCADAKLNWVYGSRCHTPAPLSPAGGLLPSGQRAAEGPRAQAGPVTTGRGSGVPLQSLGPRSPDPSTQLDAAESPAPRDPGRPQRLDTHEPLGRHPDPVLCAPTGPGTPWGCCVLSETRPPHPSPASLWLVLSSISQKPQEFPEPVGGPVRRARGETEAPGPQGRAGGMQTPRPQSQPGAHSKGRPHPLGPGVGAEDGAPSLSSPCQPAAHGPRARDRPPRGTPAASPAAPGPSSLLTRLRSADGHPGLPAPPCPRLPGDGPPREQVRPLLLLLGPSRPRETKSRGGERKTTPGRAGRALWSSRNSPRNLPAAARSGSPATSWHRSERDTAHPGAHSRPQARHLFLSGMSVSQPPTVPPGSAHPLGPPPPGSPFLGQAWLARLWGFSRAWVRIPFDL